MDSVDRPSRKHKIAYLIDGLGMGGAERLMVPILKHLNRNDFEPYVCALQLKEGNPMGAELLALGIPVECLHLRHLRDLDALPKIVGYLRRIGADLVHTQLEMADILGNVSAKLLHLPSVSTIHVMPSLNVKAKTRLHQKVEWFSLRHFCDCVISVSEEARQYHIAISGSAPSQVVTLYNGIDLSDFRALDHTQARAEARQEIGIPSDACVLVTVAVLRPQKGIQFMIRALPAVMAAWSNIYYLIVGSGAHHESLVEEAQKAGVSDRVIFAGMRKDIARWLAASDIFVLPTLTEALPTVLAEAMAANLPIVASRVGGIPEMIREGQNGYLVEPEDLAGLANACIPLLADPQKRLTMGANGSATVHESFNIERQVDRLEQLYREQLKAYGNS